MAGYFGQSRRKVRTKQTKYKTDKHTQEGQGVAEAETGDKRLRPRVHHVQYLYTHRSLEGNLPHLGQTMDWGRVGKLPSFLASERAGAGTEFACLTTRSARSKVSCLCRAACQVHAQTWCSGCSRCTQVPKYDVVRWVKRRGGVQGGSKLWTDGQTGQDRQKTPTPCCCSNEPPSLGPGQPGIHSSPEELQ